MAKRKVCKNDKLFVEGPACPICKGNSFSENWQGRIFIIDPIKSDIAKKMDLTHPGEYAIKIR